MADPVTNIQIEDVLSSIRRLVAEGDRSRVASPAAIPHMSPAASAASLTAAPSAALLLADPATTPLAERFVLTPALRVTPEDILPQPEPAPEMAHMLNAEAPAATPEPMASPSPSPTRRSSLEATIAELEAKVTGQPDEWEPDGSETIPVMDWSAVTPQDPVFVARNSTPLRLVRDAQVSEAEIVVVVAEAEAEPEQVPAPEPEIAFHRSHSDTRPDPAADATDAALAADLGRDDQGDYADDLDPELASFLASDTVMDEDKLRALVADIVRQELQGALGERITRNVRKLVRREIYRVLASQEFD